MLPDIGEILAVCAAAAPVTVLTNGMLFGGRVGSKRCARCRASASACRLVSTVRRRSATKAVERERGHVPGRESSGPAPKNPGTIGGDRVN